MLILEGVHDKKEGWSKIRGGSRDFVSDLLAMFCYIDLFVKVV